MILSLNKVEALISKLSSTKKTLILDFISKELGGLFPGIEKTPMHVAEVLASSVLAYLFGHWFLFKKWV